MKYTVRILMILLFMIPIAVLLLAYLSLKRTTWSPPKPVPLPYEDMKVNLGKG